VVAQGAGPEARPDTAYLVYLDAWQHEVTAAEDDALREVALGGIDTTARARTVWQVRLAPLAASPVPNPGDIGAAAGTGDEAGAGEAAEGDEVYVVTNPEPSSDACPTPVAQTWQDFMAGRQARGTLQARLNRRGAITVENQLYRVEVHSVDAQGLNFKWSRDNGSVAFAIAKVATERVADSAPTAQPVIASPSAAAVVSPAPGAPNTLSAPRVALNLQDIGQDRLALQSGDWVEIVDTAAALNGQTLPLVQIADVDWDRQQVLVTGHSAFTPEVLAQLQGGQVVLRRWDHQMPGAPTGGVATTAGLPATEGPGGLRVELDPPPAQNRWLDLENDVQVHFAGGGPYRPGDYWLIPTRLDRPVEWPGDGTGRPAALPPHGPLHHYALLAVLRGGVAGWQVEDCRTLYEPATRLTARINQLEVHLAAEVERLERRVAAEFEALHYRLNRLAEELVAAQQALTYLTERETLVEEDVIALKSYLPDEKARLFQDSLSEVELSLGDVVALDPELHQHVMPANRENARQVFGVVYHVTDRAQRRHHDDDIQVRVIIYGRARCRVVGRVDAGDLLVPAKIDGHACSASFFTFLQPGTVLGKALGGHNPATPDEHGMIDILVTLS